MTGSPYITVCDHGLSTAASVEDGLYYLEIPDLGLGVSGDDPAALTAKLGELLVDYIADLLRLIDEKRITRGEWLTLHWISFHVSNEWWEMVAA